MENASVLIVVSLTSAAETMELSELNTLLGYKKTNDIFLFAIKIPV